MTRQTVLFKVGLLLIGSMCIPNAISSLGFVKARAEHVSYHVTPSGTALTPSSHQVWIIPTDKLSYKQAAPMGGISLTTSAQALFHNLALPTPWAPASEPFPVLIWGGSSSVGIYAIKLAKMASLQVATCVNVFVCTVRCLG